MKTTGYIIKKTGSSEVLNLVELELPPLKEDEVRIKHHSIGINFIDIYYRNGLYPPNLPAVLGMEGIGEIIKTGNQAEGDFTVGDQVGYAFGSMGAYQKVRNIKKKFVFHIPKQLNKEKLAGNLLRGFTAEYLINRIAKEKMNLKSGDTVLFQAAAGGVGLIALQWLKYLGVKVIAGVGSEKKATIAAQYKADLVINYKDYSRDDFVTQVKEFTKGEGVKIVFDSIGQASFELSLNCLSPLGMLISYGNASGAVEPFSPTLLSQRGSVFLTRPTLAHYYTKPAEIKKYSGIYFELVAKGIIDNHYSHQFDFLSLQKAHNFLEARRSIGSTWVKVD